MGRWLASLRDEEKNTKTALDRTDKTDKTPFGEVTSVLSVPSSGVSENSSRKGASAAVGFVSFVSAPSGAFAKNFSAVTPALDPPATSVEDRRAAVSRSLDVMASENERRRGWWREPVDGWREGRLTIRSAVTGEAKVIRLPKGGRHD
jgi:hypothetical protein